MVYKIQTDSKGNICAVCKTNEDGSGISIPPDPANTDYQKYLAWVADGNEPLPPDE